MNTDDKIRAILQLEADAVEPSAAGWDAIQEGIAARRGRVWWTRGFATAGAAAAVVAGVLYVTADGTPRGIEQTPATQGPGVEDPTGSPAPSVTASPPTAPAQEYAADDPLSAIWPLTTGAELAAWQADPSTYPSLKTAAGAATAFGRTYLGIAEPGVRAVDGAYGVNRFDVLREGQLVTTVVMRGYGPDGTAPFLPVEATAPSLSISRPETGSTLPSPSTVVGTVEAVDPALDVVVRADTGAVAPVQLTKVRAAVGPEGWSAPVAFTTTARTGSVLVTNASLRDGGIGSAAVVPVVFAAEAPVAGPKAMVAARDGRIAVLSTATGAVVRWLTEAEPGGGASDPELSADGKTVTYVQAAGTCASEIRSVPVAGGTPTTLVGGSEGALRSPSRRGDVVSYVRTLCQDGGSREEVAVRWSKSSGGPTVVEPVDGTVRSHVVVGERFATYVTVKGGVTTLHSIDVNGEFADVPTKAPSGCTWDAVTQGAPDGNDRSQLFAVASCSPSDEVVETRLYRMDADARGLTLVTTLDLLGARSLDYAGAHLVIGTTGERDGDRAYAWVEGRLRTIPGEAQRPTWS